jgi:hypothetical protein
MGGGRTMGPGLEEMEMEAEQQDKSHWRRWEWRWNNRTTDHLLVPY